MTKNSSFQMQFQNGIRSETINGVEFGVAAVENTPPNGLFPAEGLDGDQEWPGLELFFTHLDPSHGPTFDALVRTVKLK